MRDQFSNKPAQKVAFLLGVLLASFWVASFFPELMITLVSALLLSLILRPLVSLFERRLGMRRSIAILIVFTVFGGALAYAVSVTAPIAVETAKTIYADLKDFPFKEKIHVVAEDVTGMLPFLKTDDISNGVNNFINASLEQGVNVLSNSLGIAMSLAIAPFITYFILAEGDKFSKELIERVPNKYFEMTLNVVYKIKHDLVGYLRGWLMDSFIVGCVSIVGWYLIGLDYPILLGAVTGIANLVPYLGPIVGAVPALLISMTQYGDFRMLVPIVIVTFVTQMIDNIIIQPLTFSKNVDMHPVLVIIVLIIGNELLGVAGMLVAIPIATILKVSATETYWGLRHYRITT